MMLNRFVFLFFSLIYSVCGQSQTYEWSKLPNFPGLERDDAIAFGLNETIYIGTGNHGGFAESNRFYAYSLSTNSWRLVGEFPGVARQYARVEVVQGKAYLLGGIDLFGIPLKDCWEFDSGTETWTKKADFPAEPRWQTASFVLNNQIYFGTGRDWDTFFNDFWVYNPISDHWTKLNDLPKLPCYETVSYAVYQNGYLGLGRDSNGIYLNDHWMYNPTADEWIQKSNFPGQARYYAKAQAIAGNAVVGTGQNQSGEMLNDVWLYDPLGDQWQALPAIPAIPRRGLASCSIPFGGAFFCLGLGQDFQRLSEVWKIEKKDTLINGYDLFYSSLDGFIYVSNLTENNQVKVYNLQGEILFSQLASDQVLQIPVYGWAKGVYLVNSGETSKKIVIY